MSEPDNRTQWTLDIVKMVRKGHSREALHSILLKYPGLPRTSAASILDMIMQEDHRRQSCDGVISEGPDDQ